MSERWERAKELFHASLERARGGRAEFLAAACGADADLRREVESLIAAYESDPSFIESPAIVVGALAARPNLVGRAVGAYRLTRVIAHGGMGTVYAGERTDSQYAGRAAVKVIAASALAGDPERAEEVRRRVRVERQTLANLDHPNIARLLDAGTTDDGDPCLVMEYVDGRRIDDYCDDLRLGVDQRIELFRAVCGAVHYAHQNLVVHRDLKPSNILVTAGGVPKLLDFGIAKILAPGPARTELTRTSAQPLTPAYASPEQARNEAVTTGTDVYALGVLLYELLTGRRPIRLEGLSPLEALRSVCEVEPRRPSVAVMEETEDGGAGRVNSADLARLRGTDPRRLSRRLAGDLESVVLRALEKEPLRRYGSAAALAEDLRRFRVGLPVEAREGTRVYRATKFVRRHRLGVGAGAAVALASIAGLAATSWQAHRATRNLARAQKAEAVAAVRAEVAEETAAYLTGLFGEANPYFDQGPSDRLQRPRAPAAAAAALEFLRRGEQRLPALAGQPAVQSSLMTALARAYTSLGAFAKGRELARQALELRRRAAGEQPVEVAESLEALGECLLSEGKATDARPLIQEAVSLRRGAYGAPHRATAQALNTLALTYEAAGDGAASIGAFREALDEQRAAAGPEDDGAAQIQIGLAKALLAGGEVEEAKRLQQEALESLRDLHGEDDPIVAAALINIGYGQSQRGAHADAAASYQRAAAILRRTLSDDDPWLASALNNLGMASLDRGTGHEAAAEAALNEALAIRTRVFGERHPVVAGSFNNLGMLAMSRGHLADAAARFRQALDIYAEFPGSNRADELRARDHLALALFQSREFAEAERVLRTSLEIQRGLERPDPWRRANTLSGLGQALMAQSQPDQAEGFLRESLSIREGLDRPAWESAHTRSVLGACLTVLGRLDEARPLLLEGLRVLEADLGATHARTRQAVQRLLQLYEAAGEPAGAAELRSRFP